MVLALALAACSGDAALEATEAVDADAVGSPAPDGTPDARDASPDAPADVADVPAEPDAPEVADVEPEVVDAVGEDAPEVADVGPEVVDAVGDDAPEVADVAPPEHPCEVEVLPRLPAAECEAFRPETVPSQAIGRLARTDAGGWWVVLGSSTGIGYVLPLGSSLVSLSDPDAAAWEDALTVWTCGDVVWAAGDDGAVLRRAPDGDATWTVEGAGPLYAGLGCGDDVWVVGEGGAWHFDGEAWTRRLEEDVLVDVARAGSWLVAARNYADIHATDDGGQTWAEWGIEDNILTSVLVRSDGRGVAALGGALNYFDLHTAEEHMPWDPIAGQRTMRATTAPDGRALLVEEHPAALVTFPADHARPEPGACSYRPLPGLGEGRILRLADAVGAPEGVWLAGSAWTGGQPTGALALLRPAGWCLFLED